MMSDNIENIKAFLVNQINEQLDITNAEWSCFMVHKDSASHFTKSLIGGQAVAFKRVLYFISQIDNLEKESK